MGARKLYGGQTMKRAATERTHLGLLRISGPQDIAQGVQKLLITLLRNLLQSGHERLQSHLKNQPANEMRGTHVAHGTGGLPSFARVRARLRVFAATPRDLAAKLKSTKHIRGLGTTYDVRWTRARGASVLFRFLAAAGGGLDEADGRLEHAAHVALSVGRESRLQPCAGLGGEIGFLYFAFRRVLNVWSTAIHFYAME
jgi:hypothetical protein